MVGISLTIVGRESIIDRTMGHILDFDLEDITVRTGYHRTWEGRAGLRR